MHLSQAKDGRVICRSDAASARVKGADSIYALAAEAVAAGLTLAEVVKRHGLGEPVDLLTLAGEDGLDCPVRHPDPGHMLLTGTGLTHLGSAAARDAMHAAATDTMTNSMKMFRAGVEGGKPAPGEVGVQPEWFFKGTGATVVAPGDPLTMPAFALDGGEEPEVAGIYLIGEDGTPHRLGFALANEFSDHVLEKQNYLLLAHSKLRPAAFGPELLVGELPQDVRGNARILRDGRLIWEKPFLSGEANMSHTIANLEHHHFKYALFRQSGDLHVHMFGTATLSFADGISTEEGDVFEIAAAQFGLSLRNPLARGDAATPAVRPL